MLDVLTPDEMIQVEKKTFASGVHSFSVMETAGEAVGQAVARRFKTKDPVLVVCGPGNNGGDGFIAARVLSEKGYTVKVVSLVPFGDIKGDALLAAKSLTEPMKKEHAVTIDRFTNPEMLRKELDDSAVVVDAIFGIGLDRPVFGDAHLVISLIAESKKPVISVDLPSGIQGETGDVMGIALPAVETVTFMHLKPGHLLLPGRVYSGLVTVVDIHLLPLEEVKSFTPKTWLNRPALWSKYVSVPKLDGHKYDRGHCIVVSGSASRTGASRLAAMAALRVGAGLVTMASPPDAVMVHAAHMTTVMIESMEGATGLEAILEDRHKNVVVIGPAGGIGAAMRGLILSALATDCAVVIDADGVTSFAECPEELFHAVQAKRSHGTGFGRGADNCAVITCHEGEFARLFPDLSTKNFPGSKVERTRTASMRSGATVVLKGPDTVVASPDGEVTIADNGPPHLATAGTGDVLSGLIGGLLARGAPGFEAASGGVWIQGETGNKAGPGLIAEDLPSYVRDVLTELYAGQPLCLSTR